MTTLAILFGGPCDGVRIEADGEMDFVQCRTFTKAKNGKQMPTDRPFGAWRYANYVRRELSTDAFDFIGYELCQPTVSAT